VTSFKGIASETLDWLEGLHSRGELVGGALLSLAIKPGWTVVVGTAGQSGMAMNFSGGEVGQDAGGLDLVRLRGFVGQSLFDVAAEYLQEASWQGRAVGVAALSALSQPLLTRGHLSARGWQVAGEEFDLASLVRPDDVVAIVGYSGAVKRLVGRCRELHVTDMRPRREFQTLWVANGVQYTPKGVHVHPAEANEKVLGAASLVSISGSALVNRTFDRLLGWSQQARVITVYGASASLYPAVMFERGVHWVQSYRVSDPDSFAWSAQNDTHMQEAVRRSQTKQSIGRADATS
jgi:uncharacterized protein (DUF4213/DUF364 family)